MTSLESSTILTIEEWKQKGNEAFVAKDFILAEECYHKALHITTVDNSPATISHILHTNLSAAQFQLLKYDESFLNAEKSIQCNPSWVIIICQFKFIYGE